MDSQRRRFYVIVGVALAYSVLLIGIFVFKREALFSPVVLPLSALAFAAALLMLFKAKQAGKYRNGFLLKAIGLFLALVGLILNRMGVPITIDLGMTLGALLFLALGSYFVIRAAKKESQSLGSGRNTDPPVAPGASPQ